MRLRGLPAASVAFSILCFACGAPPPSPPAASPPAASAPAHSDDAPTPYTAAEIRAACPVGRRIEHRVVTTGKPTSVQVMSFVKSDETGADVESTTLDETGHEIGEKKTGHATWEELRLHASFPRAATTIADETITVPAGTFECRVYSVARPNGAMKLWFAKSLPGPPVKMEIRSSARVVETRELVRHLAR
jgi:hypothetical protein